MRSTGRIIIETHSHINTIYRPKCEYKGGAQPIVPHQVVIYILGAVILLDCYNLIPELCSEGGNHWLAYHRN